MRIVVPGSASEFDQLFRQAYKGAEPIYFRLAEQSHTLSISVAFGAATVVQEGESGTIVVVGPLWRPRLKRAVTWMLR